MSETEKLSHLIGDIYDAAIEPAIWSRVLARAAAFVGGCSGALYSKDAAYRKGFVFYDDGGISQEYIKLYFEKYVRFDPSTTGHFFAEIGEPIATADLMPYEEFLESRFYKEWVRPQGLVDHITSVLDKSVTRAAFFGVFRNERDGLADDAARRRMRLIVPHVRRAVLIGRMLEERAAEAEAFSEILDGLSAAVFMLDERGYVVHANAAGYSAIADGKVVRAPSGRLTAVYPPADTALVEALAAANAGDDAVGVKGIAVPLSGKDGEQLVAHMLPLTGGERQKTGSTYKASCVVFVRRAALDGPSPPEAIAKAFQLTPMELRVLLAIVEVGGVPEVAEALGVADTTVKTHLGRVFDKTEVRRQADLVKLVAGFASPLVG